MGQYWYGVMKRTVKGARPIAFQNPEIGYLKLMEHSWWKNPYVNWFCKQLSEYPYRVGWIGDYSTDVGCLENIYDAAHGEDIEALEVVSEPEFTLEHKYLVNHTMGVYLDCDEYYRRASDHISDEWKNWVPHPLPLLTSIGNGLGGGDYRGTYQSQVGSWFWHILSVQDKIPENYRPYRVTFYEHYEECKNVRNEW